MKNKPQKTAVSPSPKEDKHLSIGRAIDEIDSVIFHAQNILDKALGHPCGLSGSADYVESNLNEFLGNSADAIKDKSETLRNQLAQIEEILF